MDWLRERFREDRPGRARAAPDHVRDRRPRGARRRRCSTTSRATAAPRPVRIGNGAADQLQLDIYGELIDSVYFYSRHGSPIDHDVWVDLTRVIDWICENWDQADEGIWEERGGRKHYTYSRLMSWVALERAVKIALDRGLPGRPAQVAGVARPDLPPDHGQGLARGAPGLRAALRHRVPRRRGAPDAARELRRADRPALAVDPRRDVDASSSATASSTATTSRPRPTGSRARRARSRSAPSGTSRRWRGPGRVDEARLAFEKMLTYANHLGPLLRADRPDRRGARELPAGVHPPGADQRRVLPRPRARASLGIYAGDGVARVVADPQRARPRRRCPPASSPTRIGRADRPCRPSGRCGMTELLPSLTTQR